MTPGRGRAVAEIDTSAFASNLAVAASRHAGARLLPVIKANGYGHELELVASVLMSDEVRGIPLTGCAVASLVEAEKLRAYGWQLPIVLLPGFVTEDELYQAHELRLDPVVHSAYQARLLLAAIAADDSCKPKRVWLKANTGMHRLGLNESDWLAAFRAISAVPGIDVVVMSHLAGADDLDSPATRQQQALFEGLLAQVPTKNSRSLAASGGLLGWPTTHYDIARPGIMLYGSSPFAERSAASIGLKPVMTLRSRLIAINALSKGDAVGYGGTFVASAAMQVGVVSIGYGDGYPRKAPTGTPVLVQTPTGFVRTRLIGRVSMDMITIDVTGLNCAVNAGVVLWGEGLPADEIAAACGTIAYELFCQVTPRVPRLVSAFLKQEAERS